MKTGWAEIDVFRLLLTALMPENRLALEVSLSTGLRISDVLSLRTEQVHKALMSNGRMSVKEQKTGKVNRVYVPIHTLSAMCAEAGRFYVFEGRSSPLKCRTRSAVYKDLKRVAKLYRLDGAKIKANISSHSARKIFAVQQYKKSNDIVKVQRLLNHSSEAVTMLYALADELQKR